MIISQFIIGESRWGKKEGSWRREFILRTTNNLVAAGFLKIAKKLFGFLKKPSLDDVFPS